MDATAEELDLIFARALGSAALEADVVATNTLSSITKSNPVLSYRLVHKIGECLHSHSPKEVNHVLDILETVMNSGDECVRNEVGKFRFLNEIVKLISPKNAVRPVAPAVSDRLMDLMLVWTCQYPQVPKIKEAYDMLRKQGVPHNAPKDHRVQAQIKQTKRPADTKSLFDEIPKELLTSKNPMDIQAAKLMIEKALEKEKRQEELRLKYTAALKEATEMASVLREMLDNYSSGNATEDDWALTAEIYEQCRLHQISVSQFSMDPSNTDIAKSLLTNDILQEAMQRYTSIVIERKPRNIATPASNNAVQSNTDLLNSIMNAPPPVAPVNSVLPLNIPAVPQSIHNAFDPLNDMFLQPSVNPTTTEPDLLLALPTDSPSKDLQSAAPARNIDLLKPIVIDKVPSNIPLNNKCDPKTEPKNDVFGLDAMVSGLKINLSHHEKVDTDVALQTDDDISLVPCPNAVSDDCSLLNDNDDAVAVVSDKIEPSKALSDLEVDLAGIRPSNLPPKVIVDEANGLKVVLHFAQDKPRPDVAVIVITTTNQSNQPITGYVLDASVPKPCKVRLLSASGDALPAVQPFRPPTENITQLLLLANQTPTASINITCIVSYCMGDDPDPIKECITIDNLPQLH